MTANEKMKEVEAQMRKEIAKRKPLSERIKKVFKR